MNSTLSTSANTNEAPNAAPNHAHAPLSGSDPGGGGDREHDGNERQCGPEQVYFVCALLERRPKPAAGHAFQATKRDDGAEPEHDQVTKPRSTAAEFDGAEAGGDRHRVPEGGCVSAQRLAQAVDQPRAFPARARCTTHVRRVGVSHRSPVRRLPRNSPADSHRRIAHCLARSVFGEPSPGDHESPPFCWPSGARDQAVALPRVGGGNGLERCVGCRERRSATTGGNRPGPRQLETGQSVGCHRIADFCATAAGYRLYLEVGASTGYCSAAFAARPKDGDSRGGCLDAAHLV